MRQLLFSHPTRRLVLSYMQGALLLVLGCLGCDDQNRIAEQRRAEQAATEQAAKRKAARDAERNLMTSPLLAVGELERRISDWLSVSNGIAIVVETRSGRFVVMHSLPATTPWIVTCSGSGVEVKFGHWFELEARTANGATTNELVSMQLTTVALTEEECRPLVSAVGQKMLAVLSKP